MFKQIIEESLQQISNDTKLIRMSFVTSFFHFLATMMFILYNINHVIEVKFNKGVQIDTLVGYLSQEINILVVILIIGFIGYELLYPTGQAILIQYLKDPEKRMGKAIARGLDKFLIMFEFNNLLYVFSFTTFFVTFLRLTYLNILDTPISILFLSIWGFFVLFASLFRPYARFAINIENLALYNAISRSSRLALHNFGITIKFALLEAILLIRFLLNALVIMGLPLLIVYIATSLNLIEAARTKAIIFGSIIFVIIGTAYINGIIEAFFTTYRYKVYEKIKNSDD